MPPSFYCSSCRPLSAALGPLETTAAVTSTPLSSSSPTLPSPLPPVRRRRSCRVLYPPFQSRRPPRKEAPDRACRWLYLLSALLFLQIYSEETHTCTELQNQCSDPTVSAQLQECDGSRGALHGLTWEECRRFQMECALS